MLTPISKAMKYLLFLFNFILVLTGISLIIIGLTINSENDEIKTALNDEYVTAPNLLIFIGCFVFIVSFFGCCGAIRESHFMIFTFSVIMAAIFVAELAIGITGYTLREEAARELTDSLTESMKYYNNKTEVAQMWDSLQGKLSCCGAKNYTDWDALFNKLPLSCCGPETGAIGMYVCDDKSPTLHKTPCISTINTTVQDNLSTIGFAGITIAVIQLLGVIFSCNLAYSIRKDYVTV